MVLRWGAILAIIGLVVYYGLISSDPLPDHRLIVGINDIVLHFGAFALLAMATLIGNQRFWLPFICVTALAVAMEVAQLLEPEREVNLRDIASSLAGVAAGAVFVLFAEAVHRRFRRN